MDCSTPGSSVHEALQARILEWVTIFFSWESSQTRDRTHVSCIARQIPYYWATRDFSLCQTKIHETCLNGIAIIGLSCDQDNDVEGTVQSGCQGLVTVTMYCRLTEKGSSHRKEPRQ